MPFWGVFTFSPFPFDNRRRDNVGPSLQSGIVAHLLRIRTISWK